MNNQAEVLDMQEEKQLAVFNNALVTYDVKESVLFELEMSTKLEIKDGKSETIIRKWRQTAKSLQVNVDKRRRKINRETKETTDQAAKILLARINPVYESLDAKVKAVEAEKEKVRFEKEQKEAGRLAGIEAGIDALEGVCSYGLKYNLPAADISDHLKKLEATTIEDDVFEERSYEAIARLESAIIGTKAALDNRLKFEADQAEQARIKAEQEEEKKRLDAERAEFEKKRVSEREKQQKIDEQNRLDREALEKQKREIAARKKADAERKWLSMIFDAYREHRQFIMPEALEMNQAFDDALNAEIKEQENARKAQLKKDKARAKLIKADKKALCLVLNEINEFVSDFGLPVIKTDEANKIVIDLLEYIKAGIKDSEDFVEGLV